MSYILIKTHTTSAISKSYTVFSKTLIFYPSDSYFYTVCLDCFFYLNPTFINTMDNNGDKRPHLFLAVFDLLLGAKTNRALVLRKHLYFLIY